MGTRRDRPRPAIKRAMNTRFDCLARDLWASIEGAIGRRATPMSAFEIAHLHLANNCLFETFINDVYKNIFYLLPLFPFTLTQPISNIFCLYAPLPPHSANVIYGTPFWLRENGGGSRSGSAAERRFRHAFHPSSPPRRPSPPFRN